MLFTKFNKKVVYDEAKVIHCEDDEKHCIKMIQREVGVITCANHPIIIQLIGYS